MLRFYITTITFFLLILLSFLYANGFSELIIFLVVLTILYSSIVFWGVSNVQSQMFVKSYNSNPDIKDKVAITYDDGPDEKNTLSLLELLKKNNAKASFFLIGKNIVKHRAIAEKIISEGHLTGNHSYHHSGTFPLKRSNDIKKELIETQLELKKISGKENLYFRPPFGVTNPLIARAIATLNLKVIGWSVRSFDTSIKDKERILKRVTKNLKGGDIILLHDKTNHVYWLTEEILKYLKTNNLKAVTIEELLFDRLNN